MTRSEFEKVYEANYQKALKACRKVNQSEAEDGVMDAVVYLLENLERFQQITPSYFIQTCVNRTKNRIRNNHYDTVLPVGTVQDLAVVEYVRGELSSGRAYNPETKIGRDAGNVTVRLPDDENDTPPRVVRGKR